MTALSTPGIAGLYIHIPFCLEKCAYCDFYSTTDLSLRAAFVDALVHEMVLNKDPAFVFDTIYLGGGTPSVLSTGHIETVIKAAFEHFNIDDNAEITMEINPGTVHRADLSHYHRIGINRLNIGAQSFSDNTLQFLGRIHTTDDVVTVIEDARQTGFDNLGLDLIYGLPQQTGDLWRMDMEKAVSFSPEHLSCYTLTYEAGTPLKRMKDSGAVTPLDDGRVADLFVDMQNFLKGCGYRQYEIANWAKNPLEGDMRGDEHVYRSRHNQKYWTAAPYIGLGPAAHSFTDPVRRWNVSDIHTYLTGLQKGVLPVQEQETLNHDQRLTELFYLRLRTVEGIDIPRLEKDFGLSFLGRYGSVLEPLQQEGMIFLSDRRCALTPRGMRFLDSVAGMLIAHDVSPKKA